MSYTIQQFVENVINPTPQPEVVNKIIIEMNRKSIYLFGEIFNKLVDAFNDEADWSIFISYGALRTTNYLEQTDTQLKFFLFLKNKTASQALKYYRMLKYSEKPYKAVIKKYIKIYNKILSQYKDDKLNRNLLPKCLRKLFSYDFNDIKRILFNTVENLDNDPDLIDFMDENIKDASIKDCITLKSKLKKENTHNLKKIDKLQEEYDIFYNTNEELDREYVLREMRDNLEHYRDEINNYASKILAINSYIEFVKDRNSNYN